MNVAILAPSPHSFVMGGAEHFWLGLQRYINECTSHSCELVKIPTCEGHLLDLVQSYRLHAGVDLAGYDRVITSKYPAWMVRHPNHALYMLHTLRGLYDAYHFSREPEAVKWPGDLAWARQEIHLLDHADPRSNVAVTRLLDMLEAALEDGRIPAEFARFPGPFARHLVHALDRFALQPARMASYTALSKTVARRANYFPAGTQVEVAYPPPRLEGFHCASDDYLFTVSRLDGPKRIGLLIEAMRHVASDIPLLIGGTGPDEQRLRELAQGDPRIRFLGPLTDSQLLDAYAHALAVPFVPYDEDYGLITIEAMRSGKPVLTVRDAGGVTEFVDHGVTGLSVEPNPLALARAIDELCANRPRTRAMGVQARRRVASISWKPLAERVLGIPLIEHRPAKRLKAPDSHRRPKAVVAMTFAATPPRGGGQSRVFHLYKALAQSMDVSLVCLCGPGDTESKLEVAPGLWEVRVPKSAEHQRRESDASRTVDWVPVTDIVAGREIHHTPRFLARLESECANADVVVACHPFFASLLREQFPHLPLWFEAQDVELVLKRSILPHSRAAHDLLDLVRNDEQRAWLESSVVYACAGADLDLLTATYGPTPAQTLVVPNGFAEEEVQYVDAGMRQRLKSQLALDGRRLVIFLGSWHGPNLEAVERIAGYAKALPNVVFAVIGSAGLHFKGREMQSNVRLVGPVNEAEKQIFLSTADLAINPMTSGTGSNLKMLDYFASGTPVLSTPHGARGIDALPGKHFLVSDIDQFLPSLVSFLVQPGASQGMCEHARALALTHYAWSAIAKAALPVLWAHIPAE